MLEIRPRGRFPARLAVADVRDRTSTEIEGSPLLVEHDFHAGRVVDFLGVFDRSRDCRHRRRWIRLEELNYLIDRGRIDVRFIALQVDDNIRPLHFACDFRHAVGPAVVIGTGHHRAAAEFRHFLNDLFAIGGNAHPERTAGMPRCFPGVLQYRLARFPQQQLLPEAVWRRDGRGIRTKLRDRSRRTGVVLRTILLPG